MKIKNVFRTGGLVLGSLLFTMYMRLPYAVMWGIIISFILVLAGLKRKEYYDIKFIIPTMLFSFMISLGIIVGAHIVINTDNLYSGTIDTSYIVEYKWYDIIAWLFISYMFSYIIKIIYGLHRKIEVRELDIEKVPKKISRKITIFFMAIIIIGWIPYLVLYFPGFYFSDSIISVSQALGLSKLNNHHPVMYAMFLRMCICIAGGAKEITKGLAIYSVVQMLYMAYVLAYFANWLKTRFFMKKWIIGIVIIVFSTCPYIAQYSIAIWKDPIFSVTIVLVTVLLYDILLHRDCSVKIKSFLLIKLFLAIIIMNFSRNNGIYINIAILCIAIFSLLKASTRKIISRIISVCIVSIIVTFIITGPVYNKIGVVKDEQNVESYGIFLAQMARVVVLDGDLSQQDREYMNDILPLEEYKSLYSPYCIDNLKWSADFDRTVLEKDFFKRYFSILKKNPKICIEAWEYQTLGYWALNQKEVNNYSKNITGGMPRNIYSDKPLGIEYLRLKKVDLESGGVKAFPYTGKFIPVSYANWLLIAIVVFALFKWKPEDMLVVSPAVGLMATLIIASPIFYWPRYGFAEQLLVPLFIIMILKRNDNEKNK